MTLAQRSKQSFESHSQLGKNWHCGTVGHLQVIITTDLIYLIWAFPFPMCCMQKRPILTVMGLKITVKNQVIIKLAWFYRTRKVHTSNYSVNFVFYSIILSKSIWIYPAGHQLEHIWLYFVWTFYRCVCECVHSEWEVSSHGTRLFVLFDIIEYIGRLARTQSH